MAYKKNKKIQKRVSQFEQPKQENPVFTFSKKFGLWFFKILFLPLFPIFWLLKLVFSPIFKYSYSSDLFIRLGFGILFVSILFQLAQLQIPVFSDFINTNTVLERFSLQTAQKQARVSRSISIARRGQIFVQDQNQGTDSIPVTSSRMENSLFFDPKNLLAQVERGVDLEEVSKELSGVLNISRRQIFERLKNEIEKENVSSYAILESSLNDEQLSKLEYLRKPGSDPNRKYRFNFWLGVEQKQRRSYPEKELLAATIGYTPNYMVTRAEVQERFQQCLDMIKKNQARSTDTLEYLVGSYGLEQKFCTELGGVNGFEYDDKVRREDGSDIYLTIDKNVQKKAEEILKQAVIENTGSQGPPKDGAIVVLETKTGKIRAMASYPTFDPNNYQEYWDTNSELYNLAAFRNVVTSVDYDPGSVMKPLTLAAALNVYQRNVIENGNRKGILPTFPFNDYDSKGKPYQELNGNIKYIRNANSVSYQSYGTVGLKECIRDSINTCIADIVDKTGARQLNSYFKDVFKFGKPTAASLPGDGNGTVSPFDKNITCPICYANFGFGQGFTAPPLQIARAYMPIANRGRMIEPYLVEKIKKYDGSIDDGSSLDSPIRREASRQVLTELAANNTLDYMKSVPEDGYLGFTPSSARLDNYVSAGKTGTSEVSRPLPDGKKCPADMSLQGCNTALGIYDHTYVGMAPYRDPQYIVLVKLSEPKRGDVNNFSSSTVGKPFKEIMTYTLEYYGVSKDR